MNKLNVLLVAVVMVFATGFANAQKIASVDVNSIFTSMPEMKASIINYKTCRQQNKVSWKSKENLYRI